MTGLVDRRLHKRNYKLSGGECTNDDDYRILTFEARANAQGQIEVRLPPEDELASVIGTSKCTYQSLSFPKGVCADSLKGWYEKRRLRHWARIPRRL
jgi:hypothetical protein